MAQDAAIGGHPPVTPFAVTPFREFGVQREAPAGEARKRSPVAPIHCQEPTRLARCGAGDRASLDHNDISASRSEVIGDGHTDGTSSKNQNTHVLFRLSLDSLLHVRARVD